VSSQSSTPPILAGPPPPGRKRAFKTFLIGCAGVLVLTFVLGGLAVWWTISAAGSAVHAVGDAAHALGDTARELGDTARAFTDPQGYLREHNHQVPAAPSRPTSNPCGQNHGETSAVEPRNAATQLYVIDASTYKDETTVYDRPFTGTSCPRFTFGNGMEIAERIAFDARGDLFVAHKYGVTMYKPPFTHSSSPRLTISKGIADVEKPGLLFDGSGDLLVGQDNSVVIFHPPLDDASSPSASVTAPGDRGFALDSAGDLFVAVAGAAVVTMYRPPLTSKSKPMVRISTHVAADDAGQGNDYPSGVAVDRAGNLYVSFNSSVRIYRPPFTASSSPDVIIPTDLDNVEGIAVDPHGSLYLSDAGDNSFPDHNARASVTVYDPPFSSSSRPTTKVTYGLGNPMGIAFR